MNSNHYSKLVALVVAAVVLGSLGTAAAVSFSGDVQQEVQVGDQERIEVTVEDIFEQQPDQWTLRAESNLEEADVTIEADAADGTIVREGEGAATLALDRSSDRGITQIDIQVTGQVPEINNYDYDNLSLENVTGLAVLDADEVAEPQLESWELHRFTEESQDARAAIDEADAAVANATSDSASERLDEAKTFYESGEFDSAIEAANDARDTAESEGETQELLLTIAAVVLVVVLVGAGVYIWRARQTPADKLR